MIHCNIYKRNLFIGSTKMKRTRRPLHIFESLGVAILGLIPISKATAYIRQKSVTDSGNFTKAVLSLNYLNAIEENKPGRFSQWLTETEKSLNRSLYVSKHAETDEVELLCFDCDSRVVDSAILLLAKNDEAQERTSGGK